MSDDFFTRLTAAMPYTGLDDDLLQNLPAAPPVTDLLDQGVPPLALGLLGGKSYLSSSTVKFLARTGGFWVRPILDRSGTQSLALRLQPGLPLGESALLLLGGREALTLSENARDLVPAVLAWDAANDRARWEALAALPASDWDALAALHTACGGLSDLAVLRRLIGEGPLLEQVHGDDATERERAVCDFMVQSLPQPHHRAYRKYLARLRDGTGSVLPLPSAGAFSGAVAARGFLHAQQKADHKGAIAAACALFTHPPTLDTAITEGSGQVCAPEVFSDGEVCYQAAKVLTDLADEVPETFRQSPLWPAITELGRGDMLLDCDGRIFEQAAEQFKAQENAGAAFICLLWSAGCSYANSGRVDPRMLEATVQLAEAAGWTPIHQTLLVMTAFRAQNS